jgi:predicted nucleotidyltransferase
VKSLNEIITILKDNKDLFDKYGVDLIGVFGSYVRGNSKQNSDVYILINPNETKPFGLFALMHLEDELYCELGIKVDIAVKRSLKPVIGKHILEEIVEI